MNYTINDRNNKKVLVEVKRKFIKKNRESVGDGSAGSEQRKNLQANLDKALAGSINKFNNPRKNKPVESVRYGLNKKPPLSSSNRKNVVSEEAAKINAAKRELLQSTLASNNLNPLNKVFDGEKKKEFRTYTPEAKKRFHKPGQNRFGSKFNNNSTGRFNRSSGAPNRFGKSHDGRKDGTDFPRKPMRNFARPATNASDKKPFNKAFSAFNLKSIINMSENRKTAKKKNTRTDFGNEKKQNRFRHNVDNANEERFSHQLLGKIESAEDVEIDEQNINVKRGRYIQKPRDVIVRNVVIPFEGIYPVELASKMSVKINFLNAKLAELDLPKGAIIDPDIALAIVQEMGHKGIISEEKMNIVPDKGNEEDYVPRCPVVTIVGHVDHGKTSLLDALRKSNVVSGESGGITQSIGASQVFLSKDKFVTFVDTPGHEAFTSMRIRGVEITDIVVLVIAADDGIKDQTIEAIQHIQNAKVPFIVCYTKIDKGGNIDSIKQKLLAHNVTVESFGGEVLEVEVSAMQNKNLDKLLEILLLQSEMLELKANNKCKASGVVIESKLDKHRGPVATVLIKNGKLSYGDNFIVGKTYGKVRAMTLHDNSKTKDATASIPVEIMGLDSVPEPGDLLIEVNSDKEAREIAEYRISLEKMKMKAKNEVDILSYFSEEESKQINLLIKGDVAGSVEAIASSIGKLEYENVDINIVGKGNGAISESDVLLAKTSKATILSFKVNAPSSIVKIAEQYEVKIKKFSVIYELLDYVKNMIEGILAPTEEEKILGTAVIKAVFVKKKIGTIAGCGVEEGIIKVKTQGRVIRNGKEIYTGTILSLKQRQYDKVEIPANQECGIIIEGFTDFHIGDKIESFVINKLESVDLDAE